MAGLQVRVTGNGINGSIISNQTVQNVRQPNGNLPNRGNNNEQQ